MTNPLSLYFHINTRPPSTTTHWNRWAKLLADPRRLIIKGEYYQDGGITDGQQGFGGRGFIIRRLSNGFTWTTTNLWHSGEVPEGFLKYHPDTHEFVRGSP